MRHMKLFRAVQPLLCKPLRFAIACAIATTTTFSTAEAQSGAFIVGNDRGGIIGNRVNEIRRLKNSGQRVEIRGNICLSSCTMYLGAGDVCVNPDTRFGFHGPSFYGQPLEPQYFEYWSEVLASHYPQTIRTWFMDTARYSLRSYHTVRGAELIRHGVASCT